MTETVVENNKIHCIRCNRTLNRNQFYLDKDSQPFQKCKKCQTAMVDLDSPSTIYAILQEIDIPYIPSEFDSLKERYGDGKNANQTVVGRYIGKMKLAQYKELTFADTDRIVEEEKAKREKATQLKTEQFNQFLLEGLSEQEAAEAVKEPEFDFGDLFTKEEKKELHLKWGKHYSSDELMQLETFYNNMHASFDIETASHEDYLLQIAKISLRMHAAINVGDFESHKNLAMTYDKLMKSAKFTASQTKEEEKFIDSISEMVRLCEEVGHIPLYLPDDEIPKDVVDVTIRDLKLYTKNLVEKEHNLGQMIEQSFKQIQLEEEKDKLNETDELSIDDLFDTNVTMTEQDFMDELTNAEVAEEEPEDA